jgi:DNA-binding response OmpR family regulator
MGAIIVLADDEADLRAIFGEILRREGHEVWEAADGREALAMVGAHHPDLLVLDVWMPVVNGFEVLDQLRHDPSATTLRVVMLSNLGDADTALEGFSGGVVDYWVKGLSLDEFLARVRQILSTATALQDPI